MPYRRAGAGLGLEYEILEFPRSAGKSLAGGWEFGFSADVLRQVVEKGEKPDPG
jgi:hypothetical protein